MLKHDPCLADISWYLAFCMEVQMLSRCAGLHKRSLLSFIWFFFKMLQYVLSGKSMSLESDEWLYRWRCKENPYVEMVGACIMQIEF